MAIPKLSELTSFIYYPKEEVWKQPCNHNHDGLCEIECALNNGPIPCWNCHDGNAGLPIPLPRKHYDADEIIKRLAK